MKYDQKYPNAKPFEMVDATIMCDKSTDNCYHCGKLTKFVDVDFKAHVCSEECEDKLISEFFHHALEWNN